MKEIWLFEVSINLGYKICELAPLKHFDQSLLNSYYYFYNIRFQSQLKYLEAYSSNINSLSSMKRRRPSLYLYEDFWKESRNMWKRGTKARKCYSHCIYVVFFEVFLHNMQIGVFFWYKWKLDNLMQILFNYHTIIATYYCHSIIPILRENYIKLDSIVVLNASVEQLNLQLGLSLEAMMSPS